MSGTFHTFKLVDGYALNVTDGYSYTTSWVDCHSTPFVSFTCVLTGGAPTGTFKLQMSNDRQSTASNGVYPVSAGSAAGNPIDTVDVPAVAGLGQVTAAVGAAGVFVLNQALLCPRWLRVVYTASGNANTTLDILVHLKRN